MHLMCLTPMIFAKKKNQKKCWVKEKCENYGNMRKPQKKNANNQTEEQNHYIDYKETLWI